MRLLLVDDDAGVVRFMKKGLEAERHDVRVAADGAQAIAMVTADEYDVIVLDVNLPDMSGFEVCRAIRRQDAQTSILMLTGRVSVTDRVAGLDAGADDYLTKPFAFEELVARIRALGRRRGSPQPGTVLTVADLVLDRAKYEVTRGGRPIQLTATEFALLELLMRRSGQVLTRTVIEEQVWSYQDDPLTNVVDVYIARLRRKIDDNGTPPLIHTIRGVGYTLRV